MEMIMIPKIFVYVFYIMFICSIIYGIIWIVGKIKQHKNKKFSEVLNRMSKHYVDISVDYPTFINAVYDIPYKDAVKVFMLYEKYKAKNIMKMRKWLKKQEKSIFYN